MSRLVSRRHLLGLFGVGGVGLLVACGRAPAPVPAPPVSAESVRAAAGTNGAAAKPAASATHTTAGHSATTAVPASGQTTAQSAKLQQEMDDLHAKGVKAFPAKTEGLGNQLLQPTIEGDVKVYRLTAKKVMWEVSPGQRVEAMAYNGMVPGPEIRVTEGDKIRVTLTNELDESTAIHFHGQRTINAVDGVPFITQDPIKPGATFSYEFVAKPSGSHMYHSHHNAALQVPMGLLGALIVEPKDPTLKPKVDKEYTMILNDGPHGFTLNGKGFPATQPLTAKVGQKILVRFMNEGLVIHPMHLHGMPMLVTHKDGYALPQPYWCDTLNIAPGERFDAVITAEEKGIWAFHCHILTHAESPNGMFGMVTALIVEA